MTNQRDKIAALLEQLTQQLKGLGLWQDQAPSMQALSSTQPFCLDTLELPQWLQFIFIEKISALLASGNALPASCNITPYAEEYFRGNDLPTQGLIDCLKQIDTAFAEA